MAGCARGGQRVARPVLGMGLTWAPRPDSGTQRQATGPGPRSALPGSDRHPDAKRKPRTSDPTYKVVHKFLDLAFELCELRLATYV